MIMLDRKEFEEWLKSKEPTESVGEACLAFKCPLATYLKDKTGEKYVVTDHSYFLDAVGAQLIPIPVWVKNFIAYVDRRYHGGDFVQAGQALEALEKIDSV